MKLVKLLMTGLFSRSTNKFIINNIDAIIDGLSKERDKFIKSEADRLVDLKNRLDSSKNDLKQLRDKRASLHKKAKELCAKGAEDQAADFYVQANELNACIEPLEKQIKQAEEYCETLKTESLKRITQYDNKISMLKSKAIIKNINSNLLNFDIGDEGSCPMASIDELDSLLTQENKRIDITNDVYKDFNLIKTNRKDSDTHSEKIIEEMKAFYNM